VTLYGTTAASYRENGILQGLILNIFLTFEGRKRIKKGQNLAISFEEIS
jgi:peroxiredoxin family protein